MPFPHERSVLDFFQVQVQAQPQAVAVKDGSRLMTYRELDLHSNRVANELRRRGLKLEDAAVILLPASCEFLACVLGVLKAGGTYFPVDVDTPDKRLEFLLSDSRSRFVLSDATGSERLRGWSGTVLAAAEIINFPGAEADKNPAVPSDPNRRAYITYTSGSTGQPKGVQIEHHALTNLVCYYHERLNLTARDRASMLAYVAFDASVADIWPVLCAGGIVTIPPKGILLNPDDLIEWLAAEEITLTFVPTGLAEILFARPWPQQMKLRFLITGGDRLRFRPPAGLPFAVINGYGPTENTVFSTWSVVTSENQNGQPPPIGKPIANTTAYVLDEHLQPVAINVTGELFLGGEQVARSYLGRPELTAERFLPDPFSDKPNARMYRTGDWVRWLPDGELDFLGRRDGQIQIRGRRVELGEIEATLFDCGKLRQVCCVPLLDEGMPSGIVAHFVPETSSAGLADELRAYLQARLPDYMVPSEFITHENLPLTPQGKLDRAALTAWKLGRANSSQIKSDEDVLEKTLARLWQSLLPAAAGSAPDATFAVLGGDSLLAIKLMLGVEEITGLRLEISNFLVKPNFAGLCEAVSKRAAQADFEPALVLRKKGTRPPLFCLYGYTGDIENYFELLEVLGDDQPVIGIRSSALRDLNRLPQSMEEAAAEVVRCIRKIQPHGAPALFGFSWAGLLAFEVARQMEQAEGVHCHVAIVGTMAPMRPKNLAARALHFIRYFPPWVWHLTGDHKNRGRRLNNWRNMISAMKRSVAEDGLPVGEHGLSSISRHMLELVEKYNPPTGSKVSLDIFREQDSYRARPHPLQARMANHLPDGGWNDWTSQPNRVHWVQGDHFTIIKPPLVSGLAQAIRQAMDENIKSRLPAG